MDARPELVDRVRLAMPPDRPRREVAMFGGLSFMVEDRMVVAVRRNDELLVRIDPAQHAELLGRPGAQPAMMGSERPMGEGWIVVQSEGVRSDEQLAEWLEVALEHHAAQSP